jgi:hypothetical protein
MSRIAEKGGHRTVRVFFEGTFAAQDRIDAVLSAVNALGASYEGMNRTYVSVDLPPNVSLLEVATLLTREAVKWEYADPPYEDVAPDDRPVPS